MTDVVKAALEADGVPCGIGGRPTVDVGSKPFVVVWPDGPVRTPAKLSDSLGVQTTVLVCHCAGLTPESAYVAERKLAAAVTGLHGQTIDGQVVAVMPVQDWAQPLKRDDVVSPPLYDLPVEWRIRTTPA